MQEAQKHSVQLQKQLDRKVTDLGSLQHKLAGLHAELGKMTKAKEVNAQVSCKKPMFDCFDQVVILRQSLSCLWVGKSSVLWLRLMAVSSSCAL